MTKKISVLAFVFSSLFFFGIKANAQKIVDKNEAFKAVVHIDVYADINGVFGKIGSGSGVVITDTGIVLTNYHVVTTEDKITGAEEKFAFLLCLPNNTTDEPDCSYRAKMIAKNKDKDLALLQMQPIFGLTTKNSFDYLSRATVDNLVVGDIVTAIGYPDIGGDNVTTAAGTVNGKTEKYGDSWLKADALTSFGSSGGALINASSTLVGLTTQSRSDMLGSMGYSVNMVSVNAWINQSMSVEPQNGLENRMGEYAKKIKNAKKNFIFSFDYPPISVTRPVGWSFCHSAQENAVCVNKDGGDEENGELELHISKKPYRLTLNDIVAEMKRNVFEAGIMAMVDIKAEDTMLGGLKAKKITLSSSLTSDTKYILLPFEEYKIGVSYSYGKDNKDKSVIDGIIKSITVKNDKRPFKEFADYSNNIPYFKIKPSGKWILEVDTDTEEPVNIHYKNKENLIGQIKIIKPKEILSNDKVLSNFKEQLFMADKLAEGMTNTKTEVVAGKAHYKLGGSLKDVVMLEAISKKASDKKVLSRSAIYIMILENKYQFIVGFTYVGDNKNEYSSLKKQYETFLKNNLIFTQPKKTSK